MLQHLLLTIISIRRSVGSVSVCRRRVGGGVIACQWNTGTSGDLVIFHGPDVWDDHIQYLKQQQQRYHQQEQQRTLLYVREPFETLTWLRRNASLASHFHYTMTCLPPLTAPQSHNRTPPFSPCLSLHLIFCFSTTL